MFFNSCLSTSGFLTISASCSSCGRFIILSCSEDSGGINFILSIYDLTAFLNFSNLVEPKLIQPTFVTDYPVEISPLARYKRNDNTNIYVERFELFISGVEIANSFSELNDSFDQRERLIKQQKLADNGDSEAQVLDEDFIKVLETGMPPTGGVGIGLDRMVMIFSEQKSIKDVIFFPSMRPE